MSINYMDSFTKEVNKYYERIGLKKTIEDNTLIAMDNITKFSSNLNSLVEQNNKKTAEVLNDFLEFQKNIVDSVSKKESFDFLSQNKIIVDYAKKLTNDNLDNIIDYTKSIKEKLV